MSFGDSNINEFLKLADLEVGDRLDGSYDILRFVSEGSFGRVYEALDLRLRRKVAVKIVYSRKDKMPHLTARFRREVEAAKSIEHSNVVRLYSCGEDPRGILYMVMELIQGDSLFQVLQQEGPFSRERALHITFQILDALVEAQKFNMVHRDLKPDNILLTEEGARSDVVKILDFGLAKTYETSGVDHVGFVSSSLAMGTPLYMAPEQIDGRNVGLHTDIYAVGLILLEMLTGEPAFVGGAALDVLARKSSGDVSLPGSLLGTPLEGVLRRCVARDPDDRFRNARELLGALVEVAGHVGPSWSRRGSGPSRHELARDETLTGFDSPAPTPTTAPGVDSFFQIEPTQSRAHAPASEPPPVDPREHTMELGESRLAAVRQALESHSRAQDKDASEKLKERKVREEENLYVKGRRPKSGVLGLPPPSTGVLKRRKRKVEREEEEPMTRSGLLKINWDDEEVE